MSDNILAGLLAGWLLFALLAVAVALAWAVKLAARPDEKEVDMGSGRFETGIKTGMVDAEISAGATPSGVTGAANVTVQPEARDFVAAASGMALAALSGPWGPALLLAGAAGLYFYRRQKLEKAKKGGGGTP